MNNISIEIETTEKDFEFYLSDSNEFLTGKEYPIPGDAMVSINEMPLAKNYNAEIVTVVNFLISHIDSASMGIIASWLYDKLKKKEKTIKSIKISRKEIRLDKGDIKKVIEEEIKIKK